MKKLFVFIFLFFAYQNLVYSQSFNLEFGISLVENFNPGMKNIGLAISYPFKHNFSLELSFNHWEGRDGNLSYHLKYGGSNMSYYFGNFGINTIGFFKVYENNRFSISSGPGRGVYQMLKFDKNNLKYSFYQVALSFSIIPKYIVSETLSIFGRVLISSFPNYDIPDWGIVNLGIEVSPFKN